MAFIVTWKAVLQALMLRDYHPDYGEECVMVCVNPQPEFMAEHVQFRRDYSIKITNVQLLTKKAEQDSGDTKRESDIAAGRAAAEFLDWTDKTFLPGINDWFARLWSYGDDKFTSDDLAQIERVDPHFLTWLKTRSIEMIEAHGSARKKV